MADLATQDRDKPKKSARQTLTDIVKATKPIWERQKSNEKSSPSVREIQEMPVLAEGRDNPNNWKYKSVDEVIEGLKTAQKNRYPIVVGSNLEQASRRIWRAWVPEATADPDFRNINQVVNTLEAISEAEGNPSITELEAEKQEIEALKKKFDSKSLNSEDIQVLVEEYERAAKEKGSKRAEDFVEERFGSRARQVIETYKKNLSVVEEAVLESKVKDVPKDPVERERFVEEVTAQITQEEESSRGKIETAKKTELIEEAIKEEVVQTQEHKRQEEVAEVIGEIKQKVPKTGEQVIRLEEEFAKLEREFGPVKANQIFQEEYGTEARVLVEKYRDNLDKFIEIAERTGTTEKIGGIAETNKLAKEAAAEVTSEIFNAGKLDPKTPTELEKVIVETVIENIEEKFSKKEIEERIKKVNPNLSKAQKDEIVNQVSKVAGKVKTETVIQKMVTDFSKKLEKNAEIKNLMSDVVTKTAIREAVSEEIRTAIDNTEHLDDTEKIENLETKVQRELNKRRPVKISRQAIDHIQVSVAAEESVFWNQFLQNAEYTETIDGFRASSLTNRFYDQVNSRFFKEGSLPNYQQSEAIGQYSKILNGVYNSRGSGGINFDPLKDSSFEFVKSRGVANQGQTENAWGNVKALGKILKMKPGEFGKFSSEYWKVVNIIGVDKLPLELSEVRSLHGLMALVKEIPQAANLLNFAQSYVSVFEGINKFSGGLLTKIGADKIGLAIVEKIGGQATATFVQNSLAVVAETVAQGGTALQGLMTVLNGVIGGGVQAGATGGAAAAGTAAGTGSLATAVAAFQAIPVVGQVVLVAALVIAAGLMVYNSVIKPIVNGIKNFFNGFTNALGIDTSTWKISFKNFIANDLGLGGFVGTIGDLSIKLVGILLLIPTLIASSLLAISATPIIIGIVVFMLITQQGDLAPRVASLYTPNVGAGGGCYKVGEDNLGDSDINCTRNLPDFEAPGVNKSNFITKAEQWRAGGGKNAEICYNDAVCRAKKAGIHPAYALWAWLHESGASNYDGFAPIEIEDFGIHGLSDDKGVVPKNNFDRQINKFLTLDPASACPGLDYWLAFSTNYLTGHCDPDFLICQTSICDGKSQDDMKKMIANGEMELGKDATSGRTYEAEMRETFSWISSSGLPSSIHITPENVDCGTPKDGSDDGSTEFIDENGVKWRCVDAPIGSPGDPNYDPNAPGLPGEKIPGECSVADKVVLTKQCEGPWAEEQLAGGACYDGKPGTICRAGCGPTSVSMMTRRKNGSLTPDTLIFESGSAYSGMGCEGSSLDQAARTIRKYFGNDSVTYDSSTLACDPKTIGEWICAGKVVMVLADFYRNRNLDLGGHFVLAVAVQDGNIITADPYYPVKTPMDGKKEFGHIHQIRGCLTVDADKIK